MRTDNIKRGYYIWDEIQNDFVDVNIGWRWINLYDDNLNFIGIGMYPKSK